MQWDQYRHQIRLMNSPSYGTHVKQQIFVRATLIGFPGDVKSSTNEIDSRGSCVLHCPTKLIRDLCVLPCPMRFVRMYMKDALHACSCVCVNRCGHSRVTYQAKSAATKDSKATSYTRLSIKKYIKNYPRGILHVCI